MRSFKLSRDYYCNGERLFERVNMKIEPGLTVLVGCNGTGKSTVLNHIENTLYEEEVPCIEYNNLTDGGTSSMDRLLFNGNTGLAANMFCSSEGERISLNIGIMAQSLRNKIKNSKSDEFWILLDAVDSGLSIDNIIEIKDFFNLVIEDNPDKDIFIVAAANEYELCNGEQCFDVRLAKYITFKDYEDYRNFIIKSRKAKDRRIETANK